MQTSDNLRARNFPIIFRRNSVILADLWGACAIPLALVIHYPSLVVCCVSSVSIITTRNNKDIKSIFGANVLHVPGLCLLGITFLTYSLKPPAEGTS